MRDGRNTNTWKVLCAAEMRARDVTKFCRSLEIKIQTLLKPYLWSDMKSENRFGILAIF